MIGYLGSALSYLRNIELAYGASVTPRSTFTGLYQLVKDKTDDTVYTSVTDPTSSARAIPNPYFETALVNEESTNG